MPSRIPRVSISASDFEKDGDEKALSGVLNGVLSGVGMANDGQAEVDEDGDCNRRDVDVAVIFLRRHF